MTLIFGVEVGEDVGLSKMVEIAKQKLYLTSISESNQILDSIISLIITLLFFYRNFIVTFTAVFLPFTSSTSISRISREFSEILNENPDLELDQVHILGNIK